MIVLLPGLKQKPPHQLWGPVSSWVSLPWHPPIPGHSSSSDIVVISADCSTANKSPLWEDIMYVDFGLPPRSVDWSEKMMWTHYHWPWYFRFSTSEDNMASPQCLIQKRPPSFPHVLNMVFPWSHLPFQNYQVVPLLMMNPQSSTFPLWILESPVSSFSNKIIILLS